MNNDIFLSNLILWNIKFFYFSILTTKQNNNQYNKVIKYYRNIVNMNCTDE